MQQQTPFKIFLKFQKNSQFWVELMIEKNLQMKLSLTFRKKN